jgi:hypothetical protein
LGSQVRVLPGAPFESAIYRQSCAGETTVSYLRLIATELADPFSQPEQVTFCAEASAAFAGTSRLQLQ